MTQNELLYLSDLRRVGKKHANQPTSVAGQLITTTIFVREHKMIRRVL